MCETPRVAVLSQWPRWQISRVATNIMQEVSNDD